MNAHELSYERGVTGGSFDAIGQKPFRIIVRPEIDGNEPTGEILIKPYQHPKQNEHDTK